MRPEVKALLGKVPGAAFWEAIDRNGMRPEVKALLGGDFWEVIERPE